MTLRKKISGLGLAGIALTVAAIVGVLLVMQGSVRSRVVEEVNALGASECSKIAKDVYLMLRTQDDLLRVKLEGDLRVAQEMVRAKGAVNFTAPVQWKAVNQLTKQSQDIELPRMLLGEYDVAQRQVPEASADFLVDKVGKLTGSTCTIFQRINEAGDMLRVTTNVRQTDGQRATGTFIPAVEPTGKPNAVIASLLAGQSYFGRAFVVNNWYITGYSPLTDGQGKVVGAVYVGVEQEKIPAVRKGIMEIVAGKTGYVFVLGGQGEQKGRYIISAGGKRDGENILDAKDANGQPFIQELVDKALVTRDGSSDFVHYDWQNPGEAHARPKVTATTYFAPWDWVIGVGAYESDFQEAAAQVQSSLQSLMIWLLWVAAGSLVLCGVTSVIVAGKIASPVVSLTNLLKELSQGQWDLTRRIQVKTSDEVGQLAQWFNHFMQEIHGLIRKIAQTTQSVASASTQIAASSEEISHGMDEQSGQLEQVSAAIHELTGSVVEVSGKCGQTAEQAKSSGDLAGKGQQAVEATVQQMYQISQMIADSSQSVQDLGKRSQEIGQIVQVIKDIADQTNLLALNAAIESARAGEHGRGFAVVADEVRKLAERTTKATDEIAESIRAIQEETGQAVKRIEAGIAQTEGGVRQAGEAGEGMKKIVGSAGEVAQLIASIAAASQQQTTASEQISQNVEAMTQVTEQSRQGTAQAAEAAASLSRDAEALQGLVKRFKIDMNAQ